MSDDKKPEEGAPKADPKEAKEPKAGPEKAKEPPAPEPEDKDSGDEATPGGPDEPEKPKKPNWAQRRIDELTKARREAERRAERLETLLLQQNQRPATQTAQQQAPAATKPQPSQFTTTEDYLEALADWKSEQKLQDWDRKRRDEAERQEREAQRQRVYKTYAEREQRAIAKYDDFEEVAHHIAPINELMAEVIRRSELGPEIAYFLGKNPDRGQQIAALTDPHSVALAIGRIEALVEAQENPPAAPPPSAPKPAPTAAPPPPKTLSGSAPVQKNPEDMTPEEWRKWRYSQISRKKRA